MGCSTTQIARRLEFGFCGRITVTSAVGRFQFCSCLDTLYQCRPRPDWREAVTLGSFEACAALITSGWFEKHRRSLHLERTGKTRTKHTFPADCARLEIGFRPATPLRLVCWVSSLAIESVCANYSAARVVVSLSASPNPLGTGRSGNPAARFCNARPMTTRLISVVPSTIRSICARRDRRSNP